MKTANFNSGKEFMHSFAKLSNQAMTLKEMNHVFGGTDNTDTPPPPPPPPPPDPKIWEGDL
jgi:hypothetical protein